MSLRTKQRILDLLQEGPVTTADVIDACQCRRQNAGQALHYLSRLGIVEATKLPKKGGRGRRPYLWRLR